MPEGEGQSAHAYETTLRARIGELEEALKAITYREGDGAVRASYNPGFDLRKVAPVLDKLHTR
jgi:hypothetical protein